MPSLKQIVPICFAVSFIIFPNFTFADNITDASTCTNGVLGTYTGPVDIEANFDPNTINTTWYNNGTAMTGNGVPSSCTYNAPLTPPTPAPRAGYVFAGWAVRNCSLASLDASVIATGHAYYYGSMGIQSIGNTNGDYGLTEQGDTWGATFPYGKIVGVAKWTATNNGVSVGQVGTPPDDVLSYGGPAYCWCRVTGYIMNSGSRCSYSDTPWVLMNDASSMGYMGQSCPMYCVQTMSDAANACTNPTDPMYSYCTEEQHAGNVAIREALYGQ